MAKHVIIESYTFTPSTSTIVVTGKNIRREQLLLITNVTLGTVIYNFSDPALGAASYTNSVNSITSLETTTIVLNYNTAAMNSTNKLSILVEETYTEITPSETMRDPVDKLRVSNPQSLIDTDFEYSTQPTKWEGLHLWNNRPSAFYDVTAPLVITGVTASGNTVTVLTTTPPVVGTPIFIQGTLDIGNADGWWLVASVSAGTNFTFQTTNAAAAALYDATKTYVYSGTFFTGAAIPTAAGSGGAFTNVGTVVTCTTTNGHGLQPGNAIYVVGTTAVTSNPPNGSWVVATTPTTNTFTFNVLVAPVGAITGLANASLYPRPLGYIEHRAFDGGVKFTNVSPYHGYQVIRQTRRYFRYQSGKGIQFSTGSMLKPPVATDSITSSGATVTVTTKFPHGMLPGAQVQISGANETAYNGIFAVVTAPTQTTFTYTAGSTPSATPATGFPLNVNPYSWYGSSNRIGMFDNQNGFYYEFNGQTLYAVKRSSTNQLSGKVAVTAASGTVTGTNTKFAQELVPGDVIVIRGMTYFVQTIASDTQLFLYPEYRGTTASNCVASKTVNTKYPQSEWNIDKCDGTGASGYNIDLTKMQMLYMDYTWYGAGAIRFGFKNNRGEIIYAHRIPNNNVNTEAYMRSGNLPARYETMTIPPYTKITSTVASATGVGGTISVADTTGWPNTGTVILTQAANTLGNIEYITYSAKTTSTFTIAARAQTGGTGTAATFTFSATAPIQAELYSPQVASILSHWGSSVIMDGRFDDDRSFVFNSGMTTTLTNQTNATRAALMSIRLAPSVDSGLTGLLGAREIINRMQLTLRSMDTYTTGTGFRIELVLNGKPASGTFAPVGGSSLAQVAFHAANTAIVGGENIYGYFTNSVGATSQDLNQVRDIGTSILSGGTALTVPTTALNVYPDGPDIITIVATPLGATNSINARISWTEAQA